VARARKIAEERAVVPALTRTPRVEQKLTILLHKQGAAGCWTHGEQQSSLFSLAVQTATDYIAQLLHNVGRQLVLRGTHCPRTRCPRGTCGPRNSCPGGHLVLGQPPFVRPSNQKPWCNNNNSLQHCKGYLNISILLFRTVQEPHTFDHTISIGKQVRMGHWTSQHNYFA